MTTQPVLIEGESVLGSECAPTMTIEVSERCPIRADRIHACCVGVYADLPLCYACVGIDGIVSLESLAGKRGRDEIGEDIPGKAVLPLRAAIVAFVEDVGAIDAVDGVKIVRAYRHIHLGT